MRALALSIRADALFTVPGVLLIFLKGMALAPALGGGNPLGALQTGSPFGFRCQ